MYSNKKSLVHGVGINDADYAVYMTAYASSARDRQKRKIVWVCPFYQVWIAMLRRSYSEKYKITRPTYKDTSVCEEWHLFSNFKSWMETQEYKGNQLDKDILIYGNQVYSPDTCVFVNRVVNTFIIDSGASRGEYLIGCSWHKRFSKFMSECSNPFTKKREYLGYFESEQEAHEVWLRRKLEHAYTLAAMQTDGRVAKALIHRYENYNVLTYVN